MLNNKNLTITGRELNITNLTLNNGWNLISYPSLTKKPVNETFNVGFTNILTYENNSWLSYSPAKPSTLNTLVNMAPGYGYWVKLSQDANWTFNGTYN